MAKKDNKSTALDKKNADVEQVPPVDAVSAPPVDAAAPAASAELPQPSVADPQLGGALVPGTPPPIPSLGSSVTREKPVEPPQAEPAQRRIARRRPAGPPRGRVAANDDAPSIGGLIYALDQKPANTPFQYAAIASSLWAIAGLAFSWFTLSNQIDHGATLAEVVARPTTFLLFAAILVPIAVLYFLALLAWRSEELRLRSSTMTEVAVRLAEPDRMAEQSVASLGQAVRRQVSFMNDAVSRALGRAGELEALVHNEVSALERSYEDNERKIRGLIGELSGEREALLNTSERVTLTLKALGTDIPILIEKLSSQQITLAQIIQGAGDNLSALENAVGQSTNRLEVTLGERTDQLQSVLENYTDAIGVALGTRTETLQAVFEEYALALDTTLANRAQQFDGQLIERTKAVDAAFNERLRLFDEAIMRSTMAIDSAVTDKSRALTSALENHAQTFSDTISRQSLDLDETLMQGINSVRRTSENITRQSLKAIEGLASQSDMLKSVSENLLTQINSVTNRFENQGQSIMKAANALESANYKIDVSLQKRHVELSDTLDRISGKADEFGRFVEDYSSSIEGSLNDAEQRARAFAEQLRLGAEATKRSTFADLEHLKLEADAEGKRALEDLRRRFANVSDAVTEQLDALTDRFDATSDEVRQRAARAADEIAAEHARLREQMEHLPMATRENADAMRRALQDQLRALEQLSNITARAAQQRDVSYPLPVPMAPGTGSLTGAYAQEARVPDPYARRAPAADPRYSQARGPDPARGLPAALPRPPAQHPASDMRDPWSLGDLLARASREDDGHGGAPYHLNIDIIARALDPATTSALWSRIRLGQRGVMVRSIYSPDGRIAFDEVSRRYRTDTELKRTVDRFLADFEHIKTDAERRDPTGRSAEGHLISDTGRVYLFLAHASGRLG